MAGVREELKRDEATLLYPPSPTAVRTSPCSGSALREQVLNLNFLTNWHSFREKKPNIMIPLTVPGSQPLCVSRTCAGTRTTGGPVTRSCLSFSKSLIIPKLQVPLEIQLPRQRCLPRVSPAKADS